MTLALLFTEIDASMPADVGGKAANLGELTRLGLPVPPGGCLTTEAYRRVAADAGLDELVAAGGDPAILAARARELLLDAPIPAEVEAAIAEICPVGPVAVRSSATAEDLPYASFAGQQDTFLNVVGAQAVTAAVRRCWISLWTNRAVAYREAYGVDHATVRLAVIIQEQVDAAVAGVMFTANPVTGRRREIVIDAGQGLGEAIVLGAVDPDRFRLFDGEILERSAGDKRVALRPRPGGGIERVEGAGRTLSLTDERLHDLAALGLRVEEHYGTPQDIEWAIDADDRLWLTQARPVTTLYPVPENSAPGLRAYLSINVAQGVLGPITPLGLSAFRLISSGGAALFGVPVADRHRGAPAFHVSGERMWLDITPALRGRAGRRILPGLLAIGEARAGTVFDRLTEDPRLTVTQRSYRPFLRAVRRFARRVRAPRLIRLALTSPDQALAHVRRVENGLAQRLELPADVTPLERLDHAERTLYGLPPVLASIMPLPVTGYALLGLAARLSGQSPADLHEVLRSVPNNPTTEMDLALWRLSTRVEPLGETTPDDLADRYRAGRLPERTRREVAAFLAAYGHRGVAEIDLGVPRWSDDPAYIFGVLANYQRGGSAVPADELFARGELAARAAVERAAARAGGLKGRVVRWAFGRARALVGLRETPKYLAVLTLAAVRRSMTALGDHLVAEGRLDLAEDVFFLTFPELRAALGTPPAAPPADLRRLVTTRYETYEREDHRRHVPRVLLSDGVEPEAVAVEEAAASATAGVLTGTPASAGTATGPVRVIRDPIGARLEPGEILVCPSTDPGWTPLFLTAGGLVMEMGGAMSHGAVVAREYGIPAVVGVPHATEHLTTGQVVTVNGATGTVTVEETA